MKRLAALALLVAVAGCLPASTRPTTVYTLTGDESDAELAELVGQQVRCVGRWDAVKPYGQLRVGGIAILLGDGVTDNGLPMIARAVTAVGRLNRHASRPPVGRRPSPTTLDLATASGGPNLSGVYYLDPYRVEDVEVDRQQSPPPLPRH
jgi:hypothetical protein